MAQLKGRGEVEEEEIEEILTPDEKATAEQVKKTIQKFVASYLVPFYSDCLICGLYRLEAGELQLDETIMSLSNYIRMA